LPRADEYARLFTDLLTRLGIPHRLHPSLPLRFGRTARALLLLLRCRDLPRRAVMEFLTFAPIPFSERLGPDVVPRPAVWDGLSREAGVVSGLDRWTAAMNAVARGADAQAALEPDQDRRAAGLRKAEDARGLLRVVQELDATLGELQGEATWPEWAERLTRTFLAWTYAGRGEGEEREAVRVVLQELAGLGFASPRARFDDVEAVLESRLLWERQPLESLEAGGVHVGALDALAGLPFRWLAIPGLVEGGFPGVLRPDPFLLDAERLALRHTSTPARSLASARKGQLSLFDEDGGPDPPPKAGPPGELMTTQDRLLEARRLFVRAVGQAEEHLLLSYARADPRSGRERLPSLFFVAAASAVAGRALGAAELTGMVAEDIVDELPLEEALDASERDRARVRKGGKDAVHAIAGGSRFFKQSHLAAQARWSRVFTAYDGRVEGPPITPEIAAELDPVTASRPISASRLATFAQCGFKYLLQHVLRLESRLEPEERTRLDPLERGSLFHEVAERFLRERRDQGALPLRDTAAEQARLREIGDQCLEALVAGAPPRFTVLWQRERERFLGGLLAWLGREARNPDGVPVHFEVGFGLRVAAGDERHLAEPLLVDLGDGRTLRVSGKIDRIDRQAGGGLVIRDYKTGRAPKRDESGLFKGGRQLQIPFYVLAALRLFPGERVVKAFLDYVDRGQRVDFDPEAVTGDGFRRTLRLLTSAVAQGTFVQEPESCEWCDFKSVCGPRALIERRRRLKGQDRRILEYVRLREIE